MIGRLLYRLYSEKSHISSLDLATQGNRHSSENNFVMFDVLDAKVYQKLLNSPSFIGEATEHLQHPIIVIDAQLANERPCAGLLAIKEENIFGNLKILVGLQWLLKS